jgi:orotidine-5'-phosphate decarboxylase
VDLRVNGPLLAPGMGAQGATAADLPRIFGDAVRNVVPSFSRGVLRHGPSVGALRESVAREAADRILRHHFAAFRHGDYPE